MKHTCAAVNVGHTLKSNEIWFCSSGSSNRSKSCVSININKQITTPRVPLTSPHIHGNMVTINDELINDGFGDTLIIIGGKHGTSYNEPTDQVEFCDRNCVAGNGVWRTLPPLPEKLYSGQVAVNTKSKRIYHFGGQGVNYESKNVFALDYRPQDFRPLRGQLSFDRWLSVGELDTARSHGQVVFDVRSGFFWLVGGTASGLTEKWSEEIESDVFISSTWFHRRQFSLILMENKPE